MLKLRSKEQKTKYEEEIEHVLDAMSCESPDSEQYKAMSEALERVMKYAPEKLEWRISPDIVAAIVGNLAGIGLILGYERLGVVTSKAIGFVLKNRI